MPTIADFLASNASGKLQVPVPVWVRLHSNTTGTDYYSAALTDPLTGNWTATVPEDDYSQYYGASQSVPGTPTLSDAHFRVAYTKGADATLNSLTITTGPLVLGADPGGGQLLRVGGTGRFSGLLTLDAGLNVTGDVDTLTSANGNPGPVLRILAPNLSSAGNVSIGIGKAVSSGNMAFLVWQNDPATPYASLETYGGANPLRVLASNWNVTTAGAATFNAGLTVSAGGVTIGTSSGSTASATIFLNSATANQAYIYLLAAGAPIWQVGRNAIANDFFLYNQATTRTSINVSAATDLVTIANGLTVSAGGATITGNVGLGQYAGSASIPFYVNGNGVAASGSARNLIGFGNLTASSNNDALSILDVRGYTFNVAALTGVTAYGLRVVGSDMAKTGSAAIPNAYSLYVNAPTIGTNNYALFVDATGSTTSAPSNVSLGMTAPGQAVRFQFDLNDGIQVAWGDRQQMFGFWGVEIRGMTQGGPPTFVAGGVNDNAVTIYGPASGTGLGLEVVSGGLRVTAGGVNFGTGGAANVGGDVAISRNSSPTTGALFFGNTLSHSILWDGSQFIITETIAHTGQFKHSGTTFGLYGKTPVAQPAAPVTLADVIAIIRGCGLSA